MISLLPKPVREIIASQLGWDKPVKYLVRNICYFQLFVVNASTIMLPVESTWCETCRSHRTEVVYYRMKENNFVMIYSHPSMYSASRDTFLLVFVRIWQRMTSPHHCRSVLLVFVLLNSLFVFVVMGLQREIPYIPLGLWLLLTQADHILGRICNTLTETMHALFPTQQVFLFLNMFFKHARYRQVESKKIRWEREPNCKTTNVTFIIFILIVYFKLLDYIGELPLCTVQIWDKSWQSWEKWGKSWFDLMTKDNLKQNWIRKCRMWPFVKSHVWIHFRKNYRNACTHTNKTMETKQNKQFWDLVLALWPKSVYF